MKLQEAINIFLFEQKARGNTDKTILNYKQNLSYFVEFLGDVNIEILTKNNLLEYVVYLREKTKNISHTHKIANNKDKISSVSIQSYCRHLKVFLSWCYEEEYIEINLSAKFRLPKAQKSIINILTSDEINKIFNSCSCSCYAVRNKLIIALMLYSGLRANEVVTLKTNNIFFDSGLIKVLGKGNKERIVPVGDFTLELLKKYNHIYEDKEYFILSDDSSPITYNAINNIIKRIAKRTGIKRLHSHLLRHTFATNYLVKTKGDITSLKTILGHTSLKIVENYLHLAMSYSLEQYREFCN